MATADDRASIETIKSALLTSLHSFLQPSAGLQEPALEAARKLVEPYVSEYSVLDELSTQGLDQTQIYEQLRLVVNGIKREALKLKDLKPVEFREEEVSSEDEEISEEEDEVGDEEDDIKGEDELEEGAEEADEDEGLESQEDADETVNAVGTEDVHGLNDLFFSIDEFNRQTRKLEADEEVSSDDDGIDYFADPDAQDATDEEEDDHVDQVTYAQFYKPPPNSRFQQRRQRKDEIAESTQPDPQPFQILEEVEGDLFNEDQPSKPSQPMTPFQKRQAAMAKQIERLENENVNEKEWMMRGEISAHARPISSLLEVEQNLDVDRNTRVVPAVTEETTTTIEAMIKQRVADNAFDDVKRQLPASFAESKHARDDVPTEKSAQSLAQVLEAERTNSAADIDPALEKEHAEIATMWHKLANTLDALTSGFFTPRPEETITIMRDVPTVSREDARPGAGDENISFLAPQEIYSTRTRRGADETELEKGVIAKTSELDAEERRRIRARKKRKFVPPLPNTSEEADRRDVVDQLKRGRVKVIRDRNTESMSKHNPTTPTSTNLKL